MVLPVRMCVCVYGVCAGQGAHACACTQSFLALCGRGSKDCNSREHISPLSWSSVAFSEPVRKEGSQVAAVSVRGLLKLEYN